VVECKAVEGHSNTKPPFEEDKLFIQSRGSIGGHSCFNSILFVLFCCFYVAFCVAFCVVFMLLFYVAFYVAFCVAFYVAFFFRFSGFVMLYIFNAFCYVLLF